MASQKQQYTVLYGRLSQEDERAGESNSILHQRALLESYAQAKGFENTLFLADDGYSGTNFDRPSWKKIIEMIEAGAVSTLIVKDTSRLGREYLQVGYYMEIYFPQKNVRFIAVNDGVDSAVESSNDFNPIRNWANELHAKDTSRKVRAVKKLQAERGERLGGKPPYGYKTSEADPTHLEPDAEAAEVVRQIFTLCASGKGPSQIARILTEQNILTPANYYFQKTGKTIRSGHARGPAQQSAIFSVTSCIWDTRSACGGPRSPTRTRRSCSGRRANNFWWRTRIRRSSHRNNGRSRRRCVSTKNGPQNKWTNQISSPVWCSARIAESQWCCIVPRP